MSIQHTHEQSVNKALIQGDFIPKSTKFSQKNSFFDCRVNCGNRNRNRRASTESLSVNADLFLVLRLMLKLDLTLNQSKQRIIRTDTDILAGVDRCASLSDDNVAGKNVCTVCFLHAKALGFAVTTVLGRTDTLLVSEEL